MNNGLLRALCGGLLLVMAAQPLQAAIDIYDFSSPELRERFQNLTEELRCPKCQNQSLAGSDSPVSADLRREVYRMLEDGYSDGEIKQYLVERYGDYILYRPPVGGETLWVWVLPLLLVLVALSVVAGILWRAQKRAREAGTEEIEP